MSLARLSCQQCSGAHGSRVDHVTLDHGRGIHPIIPNLPARVDAKEVPTVARDVATGGYTGGGPGVAGLVKSVTDAGSKTFRPPLHQAGGLSGPIGGASGCT